MSGRGRCPHLRRPDKRGSTVLVSLLFRRPFTILILVGGTAKTNDNSGISDVVFASVYSEKTRLNKCLMIMIIIRAKTLY